MLPISLVGVLVAAISAFIIGFLFHGPLFGKIWMKLANIHPTGNEKLSNMIPQMLWNLVANIVTAYIIAVIFFFSSASSYIVGLGAWGGVMCAIWAWFVIVAGSSMEVIWMGRSAKLWLYECVSSLCAMIAMGAIVGNW